MSRVEIRYATSADLDRYYAGRARPSPTMRAIVGEKDGKILGLAALVYWAGHTTAISDMQDEALQHPVAIMKAAKLFAELLNKYGSGAIAVASRKYPNAPAFLRRVGFTYVGDIEDGEVYQWQIQ